ncbi:MAG: hypothetical protein J6129_00410 [Bacteroidaceae bacterium]|nr:hypothetical protein [Bacteroidaceae bacterium]
MKNFFVITVCLFLCRCANFSDKISFEDLLSMYKSKDFTYINNTVTAKGYIFRESIEGKSVWTKNLDYDYNTHEDIHPTENPEETAQTVNFKECFLINYSEEQLSLTCYDYNGLDTLFSEIKAAGYVLKERREDPNLVEGTFSVFQKEGMPTVNTLLSPLFPQTSEILIGNNSDALLSNNDCIDEVERWSFKAEQPNGWATLKVFLNNDAVFYNDENTDFYESRAPLLWMACNLYASLYSSALGDSIYGKQVTQNAKEAMVYANDNMFLINNLPLENSSISTEAEEIAQRTFYDNRTDYDYGATEWKRSYGRITYIIGEETHPRMDYYWGEKQYFNIIKIWRGKDNYMYCQKGILSLEDYKRGR